MYINQILAFEAALHIQLYIFFYLIFIYCTSKIRQTEQGSTNRAILGKFLMMADGEMQFGVKVIFGSMIVICIKTIRQHHVF